MNAGRSKKTFWLTANRTSVNVRNRLMALGSAFALLTAGAAGLATPAYAADTGLDFSVDRIGIDATIGVTADTEYLSITNTTGAALPAVITGGLFPGEAAISVDENTCAGITTLAAGQSCTYGYTVTPTDSGTVTYPDPIIVNGVSTYFYLDVTGHPLLVEPTLDFGNVYAGTDNLKRLRVENLGGFDRTPSALTISPGTAFSVDLGTCNGPIAAGDFCEMDVTFSPSQVAVHPNGMIEFETTNQSHKYQVEVIGTVLNPLEASSTGLDFGDVVVGHTGTLTVDIKNITEDAIVTVSSAGGAVAPPFEAVQNCQGAVLAPGEFCTYVYTFEPDDVGPASHDASPELLGVSYLIGLAGNGIAPWAVSPANLDFEFVPLGSSSSMDLTVTNQSGTDLTIPAHDLDLGDNFTVGSLCEAGTELADGESCIITVTFTPTDDNFVEGNDILAFGSSVFPIHAKGLGFAEADYEGMWEMSPLDLDFGDVAVGESKSLISTLTFVGEGYGTIFPKVINLGAPFTVTSDCADFTELVAGDFCTFIVTFTPTGAEVYTGTDTVAFYGDEFALTATGTGTLEITEPVVPGDTTPGGTTPDAPKTGPTGSTLVATGAENVNGLLGLTALFLTAGALVLIRSRRTAR